jgi:AcrR family transcriptional regulator
MPRQKQVTDERLISVARQVFLKAGVNAPVSLVAKALGVTSAALFHRAGTRERLVISAMTLTDPREFKLLDLLKQGPAADVPIRVQLAEVLLSLNNHLAVITPCMLFMHAAGVKLGTRRALPGKTRLYLANWLREARRRGEIHFENAAMVAEALIGTMEARQVYRYVHGKPVAPAAERIFARALIAELIRGGKASDE